jgi:glycosyltransferase involved in cell wall biosynthesis
VASTGELMRVLYLTPGHPAHDDRFLETILALGHQPVPLVVGAGDIALLERAVADVRPDIVHAGPIWPVAWLAAKVGARPLITMSWAHDLLAEAATKHDRDLTIWTLQETDVLVVDCDAAYAAARQLGMPSDRMIQLPWGVDLLTFYPRGDGERRQLRQTLGWQDKTIAITARAHEPIYGVDVVLDAFAIAAAMAPDLRLLLVGDGSLTGSLMRQARLAGISDRVRFAGRQTNSELAVSLRAADIYVSASHMDGSSVTLLEAMATGLPAVVSDIAGTREWVEPGLSGLRFPDGDAAALGAALAELAAASATTRVTMGARGRAIAVARADWRKNRWRLADAYTLGRQRNRLRSA